MDHFMGLDTPYKNCRYVIIPVPYDATATYRKGASSGPAAIIDASLNLEPYDECLSKETYKEGIFTQAPLIVENTPSEMMESVNAVVGKILLDGKFPVLIGGEHSITFGAVKAFKKGISVLQLDAHTDFREEFEGERFSHACVMKRISELGANTVQVGMRSTSFGEKPRNTFFMKDLKKGWERKALAKLGKEVYITIDVDALDTGIMPSTGTPEPGGLSWDSLLNFLSLIFKRRNVVGFDVVELMPIESLHAPDFLCAKLIYRLIGFKSFK